jgi:DNA-binding response OmpR family regulator
MRKKILIIEDDPYLIDVYKTKLEKEGFEVEIAESGEKGLEKLKEEKFDLLVLDIVLPKFNGFEILEKIKENKDIKDLKIIVLSNLSQKEEIERALSFGVEKYLIKAYFTPTEVIEEIKKILK